MESKRVSSALHTTQTCKERNDKFKALENEWYGQVMKNVMLQMKGK